MDASNTENTMYYQRKRSCWRTGHMLKRSVLRCIIDKKDNVKAVWNTAIILVQPNSPLSNSPKVYVVTGALKISYTGCLMWRCVKMIARYIAAMPLRILLVFVKLPLINSNEKRRAKSALNANRNWHRWIQVTCRKS